MSSWSLDDLPAGRHGGDSPLTLIVQHFFRAPDGSAGFLDADVFAAVCSSWRAEPAARLAFQQQRRAAGVDFGNWDDLRRLLLRAHARSQPGRCVCCGLDTTVRPLSRCTECLIDPDDLDELFGGGPAGYPVEPADGSIVVGGYPFRWRLIDPVTQEEHGPWEYHAEQCAFLVDDDVFL
jgi:hypothetical protein